MKNRRPVLITLALIVCVIAILVSRRGQTSESTNTEPVRIGVILNLTGGLSQADTPKRQVLEAALAYLKGQTDANAPIQAVELIVEDGKTDPKAGLAAYRKLYDDGIRIFITGSSFNAMSLFPLTEEAGCLLFGVSGHPDFGKKGRSSYRMYPRVQTGVAHMLRILQAQGNPSVYVFHTDEPFGKSYAAALKDNYLGVVGEEPFQIVQADFRDAVAKLDASEAERIVVIGFGIGEKNLLKQMFERQVMKPVVGSEVFYYASLDLPNLADTEGADRFFEQTRFLGPTLLNAVLSESGDDFINFYRQRSGGLPPQLFGVFAADALRLLEEALKKTGGVADPEKLRTALDDLGTVHVFSGNVQLLASRELEYELDFFGLNDEGRAIPVSAPEEGE